MSGNHGAIEYTRKLANAHTVGLMSAPPLLRRSVHRPTDARREHPVVPADELRALLRDCHPNVLIVGDEAAVETVLREFHSLVRLPITSIRVDHRFDLPSLVASGTLILRKLTALTWADDRDLLDTRASRNIPHALDRERRCGRRSCRAADADQHPRQAPH
jgi:hypothetical protein